MMTLRYLLIATGLLLSAPALAQNTTRPPVNMLTSEGASGANKLPLSDATATNPAAWGSITSLLTAGTNITLTPSGTNQVTITAASGAPGGSNNDIQYRVNGTTLGGITLTDGQLVVGATGSTPLAKTMSADCTLAASGAITCTQLGGAFFAISGPASSVKTFTFPNASSTVLTTNAAVTVPQGGTGAATFTANVPVIGNGASALASGTRSGSTTKFVTTTGVLTSGDCVSIDGSGNFVAAGGACTTGGGGGTVASSTIGQVAVYTGATTVTGIATANNGALITDGAGVASIGAVPLANMATQAANTVVANATAGVAAPTAIAAPSCSTGTSALIWTTSTGLGCNVFGTVVTSNTGTSGGTVPLLNGNNTYSGTSNFTGTFQVGTNTMTFPGTAQTIAGLGTAQTWTAVQTFTNSDIKLLGSSTGATTFTSDNAGASNFTMHVPAANDTLVVLAATQTLTNKSISGDQINSGTVPVASLPTATSSTQGIVKPDNSTITIAAGVISAVSGGAKAADQQTFTSTGANTWTKPSGYGAKAYAFLQCWAAGGSGARNGGTPDNAGGGGGGNYKERWILLSALGSTKTVTIGAGGAAVSSNSNGNAGGNTTFGSWLTAYGGGAGQNSSTTWGTGGNDYAAGASITFANAYISQANSGSKTTNSPYLGVGGMGGNGVALGTGNNAGGNAIWGGGGGGAGGTNTTGGTSIYGGNGGSSGVAGTQPAGGGGGSNATSGKGGDGECIATTFDGA